MLVCLHIAPPHYYHYTNVSEGIELLKCLSERFYRVCLRIPSVIFQRIYGAVYIQLTHLSHDDFENTHTLSYYHHQIGSMTYLPLCSVRSWNNGILCLSFYILICSTKMSFTSRVHRKSIGCPFLISWGCDSFAWKPTCSQIRFFQSLFLTNIQKMHFSVCCQLFTI